MKISKEIQEKLRADAQTAILTPGADQDDINMKCMMSVMAEFANFEYPPDVKIKWENLQRPICEALMFDGCHIMTYDPETEGMVGCFLLWTNMKYGVKIDFEDTTTLGEIKYFVIDVVILCDDENDDAVIARGVVRTIEAAQTICRLVTELRFDEVKRILFLYDPINEVNRSSEEITNLMLKTQ